mmetsp:Transcript_39503/g.92896  ORF Transcript_39503/g.92896 Transcript_39503/m.92896 type:complete len:871 (-) Transcript_39503:219-2831(-)
MPEQPLVHPINILLGEHHDTEFLSQRKEECFDAVQRTYITRYLEALGVDPTDPSNRRAVAHFAPLQTCKIDAAWGDFNNSSIAGSLRIVPPQPDSKPVASQDVPSADLIEETSQQQQQRKVAAAQPLNHNRVWIENNMDLINVTAPSMPSLEASEAEKFAALVIGEDDHPKHLPTAVAEEIWRLRVTGLARDGSDGDINMRLTEELERMRTATRVAPQVRQLDGHGRVAADDSRESLLSDELSELKKKFILPFAAIRPPEEVPPAVQAQQTALQPLAAEELIPWQLLQQESSNMLVPVELTTEALGPINIVHHEISERMCRYVEDRLPLHLLTSHKDQHLATSVLDVAEHHETARFAGLFAHLVYWDVLGHTHGTQKTLPESTRKSLLHSLYQLWAFLSSFQKDFRNSSAATGSMVGPLMPVLTLVVKSVVEQYFLWQYPKLFSDNGRRRHLVEQINAIFMRHCDPDCSLAHFAFLDMDPQAGILWRKLARLLESSGLGRSVRSRRRLQRTTPVVQTILQAHGKDCLDSKTRVLLASDNLADHGTVQAHSEGAVHFASVAAAAAAPSCAQRPQHHQDRSREACSQPRAAAAPGKPGGKETKQRRTNSAIGRKRDTGGIAAPVRLRPPSADPRIRAGCSNQVHSSFPKAASGGEAGEGGEAPGATASWAASLPRAFSAEQGLTHPRRPISTGTGTGAGGVTGAASSRQQQQQQTATSKLPERIVPGRLQDSRWATQTQKSGSEPSTANAVREMQTQRPAGYPRAEGGSEIGWRTSASNSTSQVQMFGRRLLKSAESLPSLRSSERDRAELSSSIPVPRSLTLKHMVHVPAPAVRQTGDVARSDACSERSTCPTPSLASTPPPTIVITATCD